MKSDEKKPLLKLRGLPLVQEAESRLLLYRDDQNHADSIVDQLSARLFGITSRDVEFDTPEHYWDLPQYSAERRLIEQQYEEYDDQFATGEELTDDETMEELRLLGLDFSDERGHPLRCTKGLARTAEAAARGIKGNLPDQQSAALAKFEDTLAQERDAFLSRRRRSPTK